MHFNKYAVYATKARVYNAMGESAKAAAYAQKVIAHSSDFALAPRASFTDVVRFPAKGELICGLYAPKFLDSVATTSLESVVTSTKVVVSRHSMRFMPQLGELLRSTIARLHTIVR